MISAQSAAEQNRTTLEAARTGQFDPETLLETFVGRGPALQLEGNRGLIDSHRRRAEHLGQFFTPLPVVQFMQRMLAIDKAPSPTVADLSGCGSGRMFWGLPSRVHCVGVELDPDALDVARAVFPQASLAQDSLVNRRDEGIADYVLANPPFSDWITQRDLPFELARWGSLGPRSSIRSDIAAVELAVRAVVPGGFIAMIWPDEINDGEGDPMERSGDEHTQALAKWLKSKATPVFRIHLGPSIFATSGTEWRTVVLGWQLRGMWNRWNHPLFECSADSVNDLDDILQAWRQTDSYQAKGDQNNYWSSTIAKYAETATSGAARRPLDPPATVEEISEPVEFVSVQNPPDRVTVGFDVVRDTLTVEHDGGLVSSIKLREWRDHWGRIDLSHGEDTERKGWQYVLRARNYYGAPLRGGRFTRRDSFPTSLESLKHHLQGFGLEVEISVAAEMGIETRSDWLALHSTPLEQLVPTRDLLAMYASRHGSNVEWDQGEPIDDSGRRFSGGHWINVTVDDLYEWLALAPDERPTHDKHAQILKLVGEACENWGVPLARALDQTWVELHQLNGLRTVYADRYQRQVEVVKRVADKYGIPPAPFSLYPYQIDDVARMSMRDHNISYHEQATGKALLLTLLALVYRERYPSLKTLIVTETRLIEEFIKASFGSRLNGMMRHVKTERDLDESCIWLMSYDQIWRSPKGSDKTWADLALERRLGFLACDEAHTLSAKNTNRTTALRELAERVPRRVLASGTMIPSVPRNAVSTWTTAYGDNTALNEWGYHWPIIEGASEGIDGRIHLSGKSQTRVFGDQFVTVQWLTPQFIQTLSQGAHGREMPAIKDESIEDWQRWMSTTIVRRRTAEPDVEPYARIIEPDIEEITVEPTLHHASIIDYYTRVAFNAFMAEQQEKRPCLLPILKNVLFAGTVPQSPVVNRPQAPFREELTTKQRLAIDLVLKEIGLGKKVMLATERPDLCELLKGYFEREHGLNPVIFTGRQSIADRNKTLTELEADPSRNLMLATIGTGGVGLNLPYIGAIVCVDYGWKDSAVAQLARRICRPAFRTYYPDFTPKVYLLALEGSLDPYQRQVCRTKFQAKAEVIDHLYQDEIAEFTTWRDLIYKFFEDKGYDMSLLEMAA
jgi:hypothetical protein